jgi:hypothetical protein
MEFLQVSLKKWILLPTGRWGRGTSGMIVTVGGGAIGMAVCYPDENPFV